jgi:hypothetical protein
MSPLKEAFVLPCMFLTVVLLGGLRLGTEVHLLPPPLVSLVLAMLLLGSLVQSRVINPERLMNQGRTIPENLSGLAVLLTLFAASAQIFNLVTPETGLLHLLVSVFFVVQLLTTLAAVRDRVAMLRSLTVLLGCIFALRFIALEAMYSPGRGVVKRVMTTLLEGITLGALDYSPVGTATGYVAFLTLVLYLVGLVLVGARREGSGEPGMLVRHENTTPIKALSVVVLLLASGCSRHDETAATSGAQNSSLPASVREEALASARVWQPPPVPVGSVRFSENPSDDLSPDEVVSCQFVVEPVNGRTSKFHCRLPSGEVLKVKYGRANGELYAEVAATRLLRALGFGADEMYVVKKVLCFGCPRFPFQALRCRDATGLDKLCLGGDPNYERAVEFEHAVIERRIDGRRLETVDRQGWAWYELDRIDPARGGSPRSHVDALRLVAVILAHWDNKAENQRLICPPAAERPDGSCASPLALMHDLGSTFGPLKLDLPNWQRTAVWDDPQRCRVSMEQLPFEGATFPVAHISEEGRVFLLDLLQQVSASQLRDLFEGSRVALFDGVTAEGRDAAAWARAFADKVRQVREAGPCPSAATLQSVANAASDAAPLR